MTRKNARREFETSGKTCVVSQAMETNKNELVRQLQDFSALGMCTSSLSLQPLFVSSSRKAIRKYELTFSPTVALYLENINGIAVTSTGRSCDACRCFCVERLVQWLGQGH
eukprot:TRINITY_DN107334_c0_g1_i1.p1 TRINITY_DN107334_c0_g1~~TRINITY_DN107334_c0_g1_i1.p1  ORF type:complete len:111 (-),score=8.24 TRINITY_DN107334_c0_g1_i1:249-581(-)